MKYAPGKPSHWHHFKIRSFPIHNSREFRARCGIEGWKSNYRNHDLLRQATTGIISILLEVSEMNFLCLILPFSERRIMMF